MKGLLKSLRPKKRYIFCEIQHWPNSKFEKEEVQTQIWFESQNLLGDIFSSEAWMELIYFNSEKGKEKDIFVIKCHHTKVEETKAVLACVDKIQGKKVGIRVLGISGTIKSGKRKFLEN